MGTPTLIVVSGPPGAGKTTLAHGLGARIGAPAICRDELKEGMVHAAGGTPGAAEHDRLNLRTLAVFFDLLDTLVRAEISTIAEAAYQDRLWRPGLNPLSELARVVVIRCRLDPALARLRHEARAGADPRRAAHQDAAYLSAGVAPDRASFDWPRLDVPTLDLSTDGDPSASVEAAAEFVRSTS